MERFLDVSELEPPEPMERILAAIGPLAEGDHVHAYHRREPFPLYAILEKQGFKWRTERDAAGMYHIFIWRGDDAAAAEAAARAASDCSVT